MIVRATVGLAALAIVPASAEAHAPNHDLRRGPAVIAPVRGGDPASAPSAWSHRGAIPPRLVAGRWRIVANSVLVSPGVAVPPDGAAVAVRYRAIAGAPILDVGVAGRDRRATVEPARRARLAWIWLRPADGPSARLEFDPTAALGRSVDIGRLGPVARPVPGWTVTGGAARVISRGGRRLIVLRDRVDLLSRRFALGSGARYVEVEARGSGAIRLTAAGRSRLRRVSAGWRRLRLPVPRASRRTRLGIGVRPGARPIQLRVIGRVVRTPPASR